MMWTCRERKRDMQAVYCLDCSYKNKWWLMMYRWLKESCCKIALLSFFSIWMMQMPPGRNAAAVRCKAPSQTLLAPQFAIPMPSNCLLVRTKILPYHCHKPWASILQTCSQKGTDQTLCYSLYQNLLLTNTGHTYWQMFFKYTKQRKLANHKSNKVLTR